MLQQDPARKSPKGITAWRDPAINQGCATPSSTRDARNLQGLLPPRMTDLQLEVCMQGRCWINCFCAVHT